MAGVSSGRKPYFWNTFSMVLKMYLRRSISTGEKSRVPLGMEGFCAMGRESTWRCTIDHRRQSFTKRAAVGTPLDVTNRNT